METHPEQKNSASEQANKLHGKLVVAYRQVTQAGRIELSRDLDFQIVDQIDNKQIRIAKLEGNRILVKQSALSLPTTALRYIVAHEIAHSFTKQHSEKFWRILEILCPDYELGRRLLESQYASEFPLE